MIRVVLLACMALLLHAVQAGLAVAFGVSSLPILPAVVLVAYAALVEPPVVAALAASTIGFLLDALSGTPLGLNMLACLLALLLGRSAADWIQSPRGMPAFLFAAAMAAGYHVFVVTLPWAFGPHPDEWIISGFMSTAWWNGVAAWFIFPWAQRVMVRLGLEEREEPLSERLARRR